MVQKFWKSMAFMGIMFVVFATVSTIIQWALVH